MKLPNGKPYTLASVLILGWTLIPHAAPAGIPSGQWQIQVSDATNHVWDVSRIAELQSPIVAFVDEDTIVSFEAPFSQNGSGKLVGAGAADIEVASPILTGSVAGEYVTRGKVSSANGIARLTFSSSVKGSTMILGQVRTVSSSFVVKAALDSLTQTTTGSYGATATAAGYGTFTGFMHRKGDTNSRRAPGWQMKVSQSQSATRRSSILSPHYSWNRHLD